MNKPTKQDVEVTAVVVPEPKNLSVQFTERAVDAFKDQRKQLMDFVRSQLRKGADYDTIPGTPKPTLLKPGAEKLCTLFQLGSRILDSKHEIDRESGFAMFTCKVQVFHIPTDKNLAESEASANSEEKKNKGRALPDLLNTLGKMAFKRAFVSAVVLATNASDFFTVDLDDTNTATKGQEKAKAIQREIEPQDTGPMCELCNSAMKRTSKNNAWYCPNFQDKGQGEHSYLKD